MGHSRLANGAGNPYRAWMEYFADWRLIQRTRAQLQARLVGGGHGPARKAGHGWRRRAQSTKRIYVRVPAGWPNSHPACI